MAQVLLPGNERISSVGGDEWTSECRFQLFLKQRCCLKWNWQIIVSVRSFVEQVKEWRIISIKNV